MKKMKTVSKLKPKKQQTISIIIPVYNVEKYIKQTIDNILCQSFTDFEIILILDCPTDNTAQIVDKIATTDPRIRVIKQPKNMGVSAARNVGIKHAVGKYIHLMDSDDLINVDFYKNLITAAESTHADIAVAGYINERSPDTTMIFSNQLVITNNQDKIDTTRVQRDGYSWRYLINRAFWIQHKFVFDETMHSMEDLQIMICVICATNKIVTVPNSIYFYKRRDGSILSLGSKNGMSAKNKIIARAAVADFMNKNGLINHPIKITQHTRFKLFNKFTLARKKVFSNGITKIYLFNIPVIKITN